MAAEGDDDGAELRREQAQEAALRALLSRSDQIQQLLGAREPPLCVHLMISVHDALAEHSASG